MHEVKRGNHEKGHKIHCIIRLSYFMPKRSSSPASAEHRGVAVRCSAMLGVNCLYIPLTQLLHSERTLLRAAPKPREIDHGRGYCRSNFIFITSERIPSIRSEE